MLLQRQLLRKLQKRHKSWLKKKLPRPLLPRKLQMLPLKKLLLQRKLPKLLKKLNRKPLRKLNKKDLKQRSLLSNKSKSSPLKSRMKK